MKVRLFVGNLNFSLGDGDLREAFAEIGAVERAEIVRDRFDGRSRGFGFVEMANKELSFLTADEQRWVFGDTALSLWPMLR